MRSLVLLLAVLLAAASIVFSSDGMAALGYPDWANNACSTLPLLCNDSRQLGLAAAALGALWLIMKLVSVITD